jgi:hypothetical protein
VTYNTLNTVLCSSVRNDVQTTYRQNQLRRSHATGKHTLVSDQTGDIDDFPISSRIATGSTFWYRLTSDSSSGFQHMFTYHQSCLLIRNADDLPASRVIWKTVFKLTCKTSCQSSSGKFSTGCRRWIPPSHQLSLLLPEGGIDIPQLTTTSKVLFNSPTT